ncbi:MAG: hypothetical protein AB8I52_01185 [Candidatus Promineifilaceae bacterium]|jgi:hypothetical protein
MGKATGVSKWFSRLKGYGYINPDDDGFDGSDRDLDFNDDDHLTTPYSKALVSKDDQPRDSKAKSSSSRRK